MSPPIWWRKPHTPPYEDELSKQRIQELEEQVSRLQVENRNLSDSLQNAQQAAVEEVQSLTTERLRLRAQLASAQRMLGMFNQAAAAAPVPSADPVEEPEDEDPEPPKPARRTRHAVRK